MNSTAAIIYVALLCNFSLAYCMELTTTKTNPISDSTLQKLITIVNKDSLNIVNLVKKHTKDDYRLDLIPKNMPLVLELDKQQINDLFLDHVNDDELRPLLLSMGADVKARTSEKRNCLWEIQKPEVVKELLEKDAEVDIIDEHQSTPISFLLKYRASKATDIETAHLLFTYSKNPQMHIDHDATISIIKYDFKKNDEIRLQIMQLLCKYDLKVAKVDSYHQSHLSVAIEKGAIDLVELFLPLATPEEINAPNYYEESLLHIAMQQDYGFRYYSNQVRKIIPKIVLLLLQYKANPNISYRDGKTMPLHVATDRNQPEIIKKLIECGARKDFTDQNNRTAYMIAKERGYKQDILDLLYVETPQIKENNTDDKDKNLNQPLQTIDNNNCVIM